MTSSKLSRKDGEGTVMACFTCQRDMDTEHQGIWLSIIVLGVPDGVYIRISRLSKAVYPLRPGWTSSNQLKLWGNQKSDLGASSTWCVTLTLGLFMPWTPTCRLALPQPAVRMQLKLHTTLSLQLATWSLWDFSASRIVRTSLRCEGIIGSVSPENPTLHGSYGLHPHDYVPEQQLALQSII